MSLPDTHRASLAMPARALAASAIALTRRLTWRTLHPASREGFVEAPEPVALRRLPYRAHDGCEARLFHMEALPGGSGEPVILAHALGLGPDAYRYGVGDTLAGALVAAGFSVYLLSHRGDAESVGQGPCDFDAIVERDIPMAIEAVLADSGYAAVHWVGHGLGGQLGLVAAARREALATVAALGAPVRFQRPASEMRSAHLLARLLPDGWRIPSDVLMKAALPALGDESWFGDVPPDRARGVMEFGSGPVPMGLVDQVASWLRHGSLCSRGGVVDYSTTFRSAEVPLLVAYGTDSRTAGRAHTTPVLGEWGHPDALALSVKGRFVDLAFGAAIPRVVEWLCDRRREAWSEDLRDPLVTRHGVGA